MGANVAKPFHESIIAAIERGRGYSIYAKADLLQLIIDTTIPAGHDEIAAALNKMLPLDVTRFLSLKEMEHQRKFLPGIQEMHRLALSHVAEQKMLAEEKAAAAQAPKLLRVKISFIIFQRGHLTERAETQQVFTDAFQLAQALVKFVAQESAVRLDPQVTLVYNNGDEPFIDLPPATVGYEPGTNVVIEKITQL